VSDVCTYPCLKLSPFSPYGYELEGCAQGIGGLMTTLSVGLCMQ
jgi:hypothetical protein